MKIIKHSGKMRTVSVCLCMDSWTKRVLYSGIPEILIGSLHIHVMQLKGWYNKDDVVAEWKEVKGEKCLHVHCYLSGPSLFLDLAAEFRYHIFSKELPLVSSSCICRLFSLCKIDDYELWLLNEWYRTQFFFLFWCMVGA